MESPFLIGEWLVEPQLNKVMGPTGSVTLEPRTMRVLVQLVQKKPGVVTREQLLSMVWEDSVVTEHSLTIAISDLRKIFGDDPRRPAYIETIRGVGYRLIATVIENPNDLDHSIVELTIPSPSLSAPHQGDGLPAGRVKPVRKLPGAAIWTAMAVSIITFLTWALLFWPEEEEFAIHKIQPFTTMSGAEISPAFSPDSRRVAFVAFQDSGGISDIFVQQLGATAPVRLTEEYGAELLPTWSPDGQYIIYLQYGQEECALYKKPSFGGASLKLRDINCRLGGMSWSLDGEFLVLSRYDDATQAMRLYRMSLVDFALQPLTDPAGAITGDVAPRFSPDGKTLAFLRNIDPSTKDIYLLNWDNPNDSPVRFTNDNENITGYDWTADSEAVVFASSRDNRVGLWRISLKQGTAPTLIRAVSVDDPGSVILARSGKQLIYTDWTYEVNTWRMSIGAGEQNGFQPAITSTRVDFHPAVSINNQVAFISTRTGSHEVWVSALDGGNPVRITDLKSSSTFYPAWSPDGRRIAFESRNTGQTDIYVVDAAGGNPDQITSSLAQDARPSWSANGKSIYFESNRSGSWQIWKLTLATGEAIQITEGGATAGWELKDGNGLLYLKPDSSGIWKKSFEDGGEMLFVDADPSFFTVTDEHVFYMHPVSEPTRHTILRYDLATDEAVEIAQIPFKPLHYFARWGFAVSPDEQWIFFSQVDKSESDLMLTEGAL